MHNNDSVVTSHCAEQHNSSVHNYAWLTWKKTFSILYSLFASTLCLWGCTCNCLCVCGGEGGEGGCIHVRVCMCMHLLVMKSGGCVL